MKRVTLFFVVLLSFTLLFSSCAANKADSNMGAAEAPQINGGFTETGKEIAAQPAERKIIKTYDLQAETKTFDESLKSLEAMVAEHGGYVEGSNISNRSLNNKSESYYRSASYTLRIPADQADAFVGGVGNAFHVTSNTSKVEDVSETYYTIEASLEELITERDSLLAMMSSLDEKSDYNFWLTLQQRLSEVKQQIAVYQAMLNNYDSRVAYSTVNLRINEVYNYTEQAESNRFGSRLGAAFKESWISFWEGCQNFVIFFVGAFPTLMVLGGIAAVIVVLARKNKKKRLEKMKASSNDSLDE